MSSRMLVTGLFALFTVLKINEGAELAADAAREPTLAAWLAVGYCALRVAVVGAFTYFIAVRQPSRRPAREPVAFVSCAAAIGSVMAMQSPAELSSAGPLLAADAIALAGVAWLLVSVLTLGRCFGVLPEARGLVTRGPYRLVRHPVYLGEFVAFTGLLVAAPSAWNLTCFAVLCAAQWARMRLEERALEREFPEYAAYASHTPRLIPRPAALLPTSIPAPSAGTR